MANEDPGDTIRSGDETSEGPDAARLFAEVALSLGFLSKGKLREAERERARRESLGETASMPLVLRLLGLLGPEQIRRVQAAARKIEERGGSTTLPALSPAGTVLDSCGGPLPVESSGFRRDTFGRYRSATKIARGGMGEILGALDPLLLRPVAIKVLPAGVDRSDYHARKFLAEAQITGQLEHPNIVPIHELGSTGDGEAFFSMKFVRGRSLAEEIQEIADLPSERADRSRRPLLEALLKVCDAVAYAHSRGVVHRDLKPSNIMLGEFGEVLVMDWGIAKVLAEAAVRVEPDACVQEGGPEVAADHADSDRTMEGAILGTPAYMPPEQAAGEVARIDARSDVYSLGAILYEILTRTPPYRGPPQEVLNRITLGILEPPSRRAPNAAVPRELEAVVLKAMAPEPEARYGSVEALSRDVRAYLEGYAVSARPDNPVVAAAKWIRRNRAVSIGVAALALGLVTALFVQRARNVARVSELLRDARAKYATGDFAGARDDATRALALAPDHREAEALAESARREGELAGRVEPLRSQLASERSGVAAFPAEDRKALLGARARILLLSRELVRLLPGSEDERAGLASSAREMAHVLLEDGNHDMAELMIDEAEACGLDPGLVRMERWRIAESRGGPLRKAQVALGAARARILAPQERAMHVDELLRVADEGAVAALIPGVFGWPLPALVTEEDWQKLREGRRLAIEALGRIGDARTTAFCHPDWVGRIRFSGLDDAWVRELLEDRAARWLPGARPSRLDAVQAISLALLGGEAGPGFDVSVELAVALGRLADPRGDEFLDAKRWAAGPGSSFWRATREAYLRIPLPDVPAAEATDPAVRYRRARALHGKERLAEAVLEYDEAERLGAGPAAAILGDRGLARLEAGDRRAALVDLDEAVRLDPGAPGPLLRRGRLRLAAGDAGGARADLEAASRSGPPDPLVAFALGEALEALGEDSAAVEGYSRAIELDHRFAPALVRRAARRLAGGDPRDGLADATLAIRYEPWLAEAYVVRSRALLDLGMARAALEDGDAALVLDPSDADAWVAQSRAHAAGGDRREALLSLGTAVAMRPDDVALRLEHATALLEEGRMGSMGGWEEAEGTFSGLIERSPDRTELWWGRGVARAGEGRHEEALADLDRALALDPRSARARADRGMLLLGLRDAERARTDLAAALEEDPGNERALRTSILLAGTASDREALIGRAREALGRSTGKCDGLDTRDRRGMEWFRIAQALHALGERSLALSALDRSIDDLPPSLAGSARALRPRFEAGK